MEITAKDYVKILKEIEKKLKEEKDCVTDLDLATGDGDHWSNMDSGFSALVEKSKELEKLDIREMFKEIGMTMMSVIGGSSGVLYGGAYIAAAKATKEDKKSLNTKELAKVLESMSEDMKRRGRSEEGHKTMIDAIAPAAEEFKKALKEKKDEKEIFERVKKAALEGAEATKDMEAIRGRASYQKKKGVGHLDPGAVTMSYQIEILCDYIIENLL